MLCEEGDPMFTALVTAAGGLNMRTLAANIKNKPPDEIMASMGKGDGDSGSGLSDDDWDELVALGPYLSWAWNYWGPQADRSNPMDYYTWLTRENFDIFLEEFNDVEIRDHYNVKETQKNRDRRLDKERKEKERRIELERKEKERRIELDEYRAACQQRKKDRQIQSKQRKKDRQIQLEQKKRRKDKYNRNRGRRKGKEDVNVIGMTTVGGRVGRNRITSPI